MSQNLLLHYITPFYTSFLTIIFEKILNLILYKRQIIVKTGIFVKNNINLYILLMNELETTVLYTLHIFQAFLIFLLNKKKKVRHGINPKNVLLQYLFMFF